MVFIKTYLLKIFLSAAACIARVFLYTRHPPMVRQFIPDVSYGYNRKQRLDIIVPHGNPPYPIVIYVHGGGWLVGTKKSYTRICRDFATKGYLLFNINYRLAPRYGYPSQLQDVAAAIYWVFTHAQRYGGDADAIFLAGDSAGAQLASWYAVALHKRELLEITGIEEVIPPERLRGLVLFYGVFDFEAVSSAGFPPVKIMSQSFLGNDPHIYHERAAIASPIRHITDELPPVFLCASEADWVYPQSVALMRALKSHNVPYTTFFLARKSYPDARHGFLNLYYKRCAKAAMEHAVSFLRNPPKQPGTQGD